VKELQQQNMLHKSVALSTFQPETSELKEWQPQNMPTQVSGIDYIPTRNVPIKRIATSKHVAQVSSIALIPIVRIEQFAFKKHAFQSGAIGHIPRRNILVEIAQVLVAMCTEYSGKVTHSLNIPLAYRIMAALRVAASGD
jgi:hypothetical protein